MTGYFTFYGIQDIGTLLIIFSVLLVGGILYGAWFLRSLRRRRWWLALALITLPAVVVSLPDILIYLRDRERAAWMAKVYQREITLGPLLYERRERAALPGELYAFQVYEIPELARYRFIVAMGGNDPPLTKYPRLPDQPGHWEIDLWRESPLPREMREEWEELLCGSPDHGAPVWDPYIYAARAAVWRQGYTFRMSYTEISGGRAARRDILVADMVKGRFYLIRRRA